MQPDTLSVLLRSLSFIALFQAAGMALFLAMFGRSLDASLAFLGRIAILSANAAITLLVGQYLLEAARMADDWSGIFDASMQKMLLNSTLSIVLALRCLGVSILVVAIGRCNGSGKTYTVIGVMTVAASFLFMGHTSVHPLRWVLAPLLLVHVAIVTFWFGALVPLYVASTREIPAVAAQVTDAFSRVAGWLVPGIFVAGVLMGLMLVRQLAEFRLGYGVSLLGKVGGFAVLMGLAALNKWRLGPAIATGQGEALRSFRRSLIVEYVLIALVLSITAVMTTLYSPEKFSSLP